MATTPRKRNVQTAAASKSSPAPAPSAEVAAEEKVYGPTDGIPCRSITAGGLYMDGKKSNISYAWSDEGDVTEVEYQDLVAAIRSRSDYIFRPFFVIEDEDVIKKFPQLDEVYKALYPIKDLRDVILKSKPAEMKKIILSLPLGAQDSVKHIASDMVSKGELDSVQKIKVLDEIFDTGLMLMTGLFGN